MRAADHGHAGGRDSDGAEFGSTGQTAAFMSVSVSGATTLPGSDANSLRVFGNNPIRASAVVLLDTF